MENKLITLSVFIYLLGLISCDKAEDLEQQNHPIVAKSTAIFNSNIDYEELTDQE